MDIINTKYYDGFEGEPEIQFIRVSKKGEKHILSLWHAYFEIIMHSIIPIDFNENQLSGLAYIFFKREGWYDESPWQMPDIDDAIKQLKNYDSNNLTDDEKESLGNVLDDIPQVLEDIIKFLDDAKRLNEIVYISYN